MYIGAAILPFTHSSLIRSRIPPQEAHPSLSRAQPHKRCGNRAARKAEQRLQLAKVTTGSQERSVTLSVTRSHSKCTPREAWEAGGCDLSPSCSRSRLRERESTCRLCLCVQVTARTLTPYFTLSLFPPTLSRLFLLPCFSFLLFHSVPSIASTLSRSREAKGREEKAARLPSFLPSSSAREPHSYPTSHHCYDNHSKHTPLKSSNVIIMQQACLSPSLSCRRRRHSLRDSQVSLRLPNWCPRCTALLALPLSLPLVCSLPVAYISRCWETLARQSGD